FNIDPRIVAPGVRAVLLTEVANRSVAQAPLKEAVEYSARVRITLPEVTCLDCVSAALLAALIDDEAFANEALDRLPLSAPDVPAVSGALEDIEIFRKSRTRLGVNVPPFVQELESCMTEALQPKAAVRPQSSDRSSRPAAQANDDKGANAVDTKK